MKHKIHIIEVQHNENKSIKKILRNIEEKKITYLKNKYYKNEEILEDITVIGPAIILNSSGSTGKPRKCLHYLENLNLSAQTSGTWLEAQGFKLQNCLIFNTLPLHHISGLMPIFRSLVWKCDYINISPNLIKNTKDLLALTMKFNKEKKHFITSLVPTQLKRLLTDEEGLKWLKIFDLIWIGGASISPDTASKCIKEKIKLAPCYGSTETAAMVTSLKPEEFLMGYDYVGEILSDTNIRINQKGLIEIYAERIGIELIENSKTKSFRNKNGWWETSDLGEITKFNNSLYLKFIGRIDNAFNSGGEIVYPEVIKSRLNIFIMKENLPINKFKISKVPNNLWENRIEITIEFKKSTNIKNIENALKKLENLSKNWPKHERPENWIINKKLKNK